MKIYLIRHGEALSIELDSEKSLSPQGRQDVQKIAKFLGTKSFPIAKIFHSGKARTLQTAEIFMQYLAPKASLELFSKLGPNDPIENMASCIQNEKTDFMIVGHLPFLQKILGFLVTGHEEHILVDFQAATIVCLDKNTKFWIIDWVIGPNQL